LSLLDGRQPQALERDLGQSRAKLAAAGDQQPGNAVRAQSSLKILRFTQIRTRGCPAFLLTTRAIRATCRQFVMLCRRLDLFSETVIAIDGVTKNAGDKAQEERDTTTPQNSSN